MADLAQGLLHGLTRGVDSYFQADQASKDRALREKQMQDDLRFREADALSKGLIKSETGDYIKDPAQLARERASKINKTSLDLIAQGYSPRPDFFNEEGDLNLEALGASRPAGLGTKAIDAQLKQAQLNKLLGEQTEKTEKKALAKETQDRYSKVAIQDAQRALEMIPGAAGPWRGQLGKIPGTKAAQLEQMLDSVKSSASFDRLQAMRNASPTGGALGNVSEKELALLQAAAGKLTAAMDQKTLEDNLKRYINLTNDIVHGPNQGPERYALSFEQKAAPGLVGQQPQGLIGQPQAGAQPASGAAPVGGSTVRVKNPDGQIGTIPRSQLEAAKAQRYMEVK